MSLTKEELRAKTREIVDLEDKNILTASADLICFYLENCEITVPEENRFFVNVNCLILANEAGGRRFRRFNIEPACGEEVLAYTGTYDFGHTSADWQSVIDLGIYGLRERVSGYLKRTRGKEECLFYREAKRVLDAAIEFMKKAANAARLAGKDEMAMGIEELTRRAPETLFEAMQTTAIYYTLQQTEGAILRTLGRLDTLYYRFYKKESSEGTVRELVRDFYREIDNWRAGSNIPIALGASPRGEYAQNELTLIFLSEYRRAHLPYTKIHLLCREDTSDAVLREAMSAVREGNNSIIFMSDKTVTRALIRLGEDEKDAMDYHVVGCYECGGQGELTCSCNARVSIPKAVEYALTGGVDILAKKKIGLDGKQDFKNFEELYCEFLRQLTYLTECGMRATEEYEKHYPEAFAAPILSSTYSSSLEKGKDLYAAYGAKYNNSSINALGLATATDALLAIKKLVFDDAELTLGELVDILRNNWQGYEGLRLKVKNKFPKYGMGHEECDEIAKRTVEHLGKTVNGRKNPRGGVWRLGLFSIDWRWDFGKKTAASADSRLAGEPISQNTGASFGQDRNGMTAHIRSVSALDNTLVPNGAVLDLDLHSSCACGEDGLCALVSGLRTFIAFGGFGIHYNILNEKTLCEAKKRPEDYPTLQVRLCGWNALFTSLTEKEQDEFIRRAQAKNG